MTKWERRLTWVWVAFFVWMIWAMPMKPVKASDHMI